MDRGPLAERLLVLLTGPVGGGKSTVALALADHLRQSGRASAVIDLDLVYCMARQADGFGEANTWQTARRGAAALADAFFAGGLEVVVVEGGFFSEEECKGLRDHLASSVRERVVTLDVSYGEALRRAQGDPDPTRVGTRDPQVLQRHHTQFVSALPFLNASSLVVEADRLTPQELARLIAETVLADAGPE
jgi:thymidylate kinase